MPSKTFQPLLFDSFQYKYPNTTYEDHYNKNYRKSFLAKAFTYKTLNQREKMALLTKRSRPFTANTCINDKTLSKSHTFSFIKKFDNHVSCVSVWMGVNYYIFRSR
jgi:hypothetical protein